MVNVWGYSHLNFFAPMSRFGSGAWGQGWQAAGAETEAFGWICHWPGISRHGLP